MQVSFRRVFERVDQIQLVTLADGGMTRIGNAFVVRRMQIKPNELIATSNGSFAPSRTLSSFFFLVDFFSS